jgi:phosphoenolpyruvate carboxylase
MGFAKKLASTDPRVIKTALYELLKAETAANILALDAAYETAENKQAFLAEFEVSGNAQFPERNPVLLEQWTHYRWLRLELSYLANQKASLNQIAYAEVEQFAEAKSNDVMSRPAITDSINLAIQEDVHNGVPIQQSIATLRKMRLQIVGTEHPTDPLSQAARDALTNIAIAMDATHPDKTAIQKILATLRTTDAIPPSRRAVEEEVNRNINMTLDKLYDAVPAFIQSILTAYETYYGEELFLKHQEEILLALEGGLQANGQVTQAILRDASWAGFDADGNDYVTPDSMRYAFRLHRIRSAEKHISALETNAVETSKEIERDLRKKIIALNLNIFERLVSTTQHPNMLLNFYSYQNTASQFLVDRKFADLVTHYDEQKSFIEQVEINATEKEKILALFSEQHKAANRLKQLTQFSGTYRIQETLHQGDLQKFQETFKNYKNAVRERSDAITIEDSDGQTHLPTEFALKQYHAILQKHAALLDHNSKLNMQMRHFGIQLSCFGMTHGAGHIRQDSSVYMKVWGFIFNHLKQEAVSQNFSFLDILHDRRYEDLTENERENLHKRLRNGSVESQQVLSRIRQNYIDMKYKNHAQFNLVQRELERLELALKNKDMVENVIISNSESAANILEVDSLLNVFPDQRNEITVVPLLEKRQDLENYEAILTSLIKSKIQKKLETAYDNQIASITTLLHETSGVTSRSDIANLIEGSDRQGFKLFLVKNPLMRDYLKDTQIEVMVGFSDTERVSGLPALISVQQVQEDFIHLAQDFGLQPKLYHGPGGDANRGGLRRRDEKATLQGNARSNMLATPHSTLRFRETQFYQAYKNKSQPARRTEFTNKPAHIQELITECKNRGADFYEHLHDTEAGLGKLLGFMLGQGVHWMVNILNSSSRATQRGIAENQGDRTASVQTGGMRPEAFIHPDKPRAISATQIKEMLRDNIHLLMGSGYGLRKLGKDRAERLYDTSATMRDLFLKTLVGLARTDFSIAETALFSSHPELKPKNQAEREEWAHECKTQYSLQLKNMNIEEMIKTPAGKQQVLIMMSRLFAFIQVESEKTQRFISRIYRTIYPEKYSHHATSQVKKPTDILAPYPALQAVEEDAVQEVEPLSQILARQNQHVSDGKNLDQIYRSLNEEKPSTSKLTGVGRLLGNVGAGITAFRIMPPAMYDTKALDLSEDMRNGVTRAESEAVKLGKEITYGKKGKNISQFFPASTINKLENMFDKHHKNAEERTPQMKKH